MKMSKECFNDLKQLVTTYHVDPATPECAALKAQYEQEGLSDRRFRFDCLWGIPHPQRQEWFDKHRVYDREGQDLNDDHIHTALKAIVG